MANILSTGDALLLFPETGLLLYVQEGSGDNLLSEDLSAGYVDYLDWTSYKVSAGCDPELLEHDGGMAMFKTSISSLPDDALIKTLKYEAGIDDASTYISVKTA